MAQRRVRISGAAGLHARPAAELARLALSHDGGIRIAAGGVIVDAASVLAVMGLTLQRGEDVVIHADGPGADDVLERAAALL